MDDIVDTLRSLTYPRSGEALDAAAIEAIDEIERLRKIEALAAELVDTDQSVINAANRWNWTAMEKSKRHLRVVTMQLRLEIERGQKVVTNDR